MPSTLFAVFRHVAVATETGGPEAEGNLVVFAAKRPVNSARWVERLTGQGAAWSVLSGPELASWTGRPRADRRL